MECICRNWSGVCGRWPRILRSIRRAWSNFRAASPAVPTRWTHGRQRRRSWTMPFNVPDGSGSVDGPFSAIAALSLAVASMRQAMLSADPTRITDAMPSLEHAALSFRKSLQWVLQGGIPADARWRRGLVTLRRDLARLGKLSQSGAEVYQSLARLLGSAAGGYTPRGDGAPLPAPQSVWVRG
jgi:hypothetical protein